MARLDVAGCDFVSGLCIENMASPMVQDSRCLDKRAWASPEISAGALEVPGGRRTVTQHETLLQRWEPPDRRDHGAPQVQDSVERRSLERRKTK